MKKIFLNALGLRPLGSRGSTILGALFILTILGVAGMTMVTMTSGNNANTVHDMQSQQSFYVGHAGLEKAKYDLYWGNNPTVSNKAFAQGTYSTTANANQGLVTVSSIVGDTKKNQTISVNFGKHCVQLDTSMASIGTTDGHNMLDVKLIKTCNGLEVVSKMWIDWNWDPCVLAGTYSSSSNLSNCPKTTNGGDLNMIYLDGTDIYNPGLGKGSPGGGGADPGETIDVVDFAMSTNKTYVFDKIRFGQAIPNGALTTITLEFSDGSQLSSTFQIKTGSGFTVKNGKIDVDPYRTVKAKVLCSLISYGSGGPDVPVKVRLKTNNSWQNLWNYADVNGGETYTTTTGSSNKTSYILEAFAKYSSWQRTYDSSNTKQVMTLVNNDTPPALAGYGGQQSVAACIAPYLNSTTKKVKLNGNQSIQLFELGVDMTYNQSNPAADFQDLVVLWDIN